MKSPFKNKKTSFAMQGTQWRITYSCTVADSGNSYSDFTGFVYSIDGSVTNLFANTENCPTNNTSYVLSIAQDPGQYYLQIEPITDMYSVKVEDYY